MSHYPSRWLTIATFGSAFVLAACADHPANVASNPPPHQLVPEAVWYHVNFEPNSSEISAADQKTISDVTGFLQANPSSIATIIGRTDTWGSHDYNVHLSHHRADAVRDALVYTNNIASDRIETRWTGGKPQPAAAATDANDPASRTVDIAID